MKTLAAALLMGTLISQPAQAQVRQAIHEPFTGPMTAAKIRIAIDDGILHLRNLQAENGSIQGSGPTEMAALTILAAGFHPETDPQLKKALEWIATQEPNNTYIRGVRANVWEYALRKSPDNKKYQELLKKDFDWLMKAQSKSRGWRYNISSTDWDNSCTQYGVLGIWAASRAGLDPGDAFWKKMSEHFRKVQNADGGWSYTTGGSTPAMATAGLASLFLVFDKYHGKSFYSKKNPRTFADGDAAAVLAALEKGMNWLGESKGNKNDGYYLYGIERTGVASGRKYFGGEDWFKRGALTILKAQRPDGSIPLGHWGGSAVGTSFCTLFLIYGGAPVAFNKLQYGEGHDWNLNPRDLANLSKDLWSAYERPLNWQTVSISAPASEIEAPILFISGSKAAKFTASQQAKLREYVLRGGTIFAESSDHSAEFTKSMEHLLGQMFSSRKYPKLKLEELPADHAIYTVLKQDWKQKPKLRAASDGSRIIFLISDGYLSADWQMNRVESDAFKLATNLLFYATDLSTLEGKFAGKLPEKPVKEREGTVTVARVRHSNIQHPADFEAAEMLWFTFSDYALAVSGKKLVERPAVTPGGKNDKLDGIDLLHITGRETLTFNELERTALKKFIEDGGTVLVDAYAGSTTFSESAKRELESIFGKLTPLPADHVLAEGRFAGGEDLSLGIRYKLPARQQLRKQGRPTKSQALQVVMHHDRPAVIFSEFDLSAAAIGVENYRSPGYKPASARRILGNLVAYLAAD